MSALAIAPTLGPRPLAPLGQSRLRALRQTKMSNMNRMNGVPRSTPLKRSIVYNSDEENIVPATKLENTKRKRTIADDEQLSESPKSLKTSHVSSVPEDSKPIEILTPRKINLTIGKPAGRAPLAKSFKAFGRRSQRDSFVKRPAQAPSYIASKPAPRSTRQTTQPAGWFFDIHVDTPEEEATNTMQHFAGRLDISDDEVTAKVDDRGKENVPPHELGIAMPTTAQSAISTSHNRKNMMALSRSPLGELKASDYYPADLQGVFHAVILDEDSAKSASKLPGPSTVSDSLESAGSENTSPGFANTKDEIPFAADSGSAVEEVAQASPAV